MLLQIALFVVSLVVSYALQPKPQRPKAAAFESFDFPTVEDGTPQIVVFGDVWLTDWTVLGVGNYRTSDIKVKQKTITGSKKVTTGYRYYMSIHMGLCRGIDDLVEVRVGDRAVWQNTLIGTGYKQVIYMPNLFGGDKGEGGIDGLLTIFKGDSDQAIPGELKWMFGEDVPAYRGIVTFHFDGQICANSPYPKPWSFRVRRVTEDWDGSVWYESKSVIWMKDNTIKAMNPAHILYEVQTNAVWGRGFSADQLDLQSFITAADQLHGEKFGLCLAWRRQDSLKNFIQQVLDQVGGALFINRTTGLWKLVLIRDNYKTDDLKLFDYSTGLLRTEEDNNAATDLATNQTVVTFKNPVNNLEETIRAENVAAIQQHGLISENKSYEGIPTAELAGRIAARDMKISQSSLKKFKLVFDRRAYAIQPADVFRLALPERGIESIVVRAVRVEHNTLTNGEITVTVVQDVFGLPASSYLKDQPSMYEPPNFDPQPILNKAIFEMPFVNLLSEYSLSQLTNELKDYSFIAVAAEKPSSIHLDLEVFSKSLTESEWSSGGHCDYSFTAQIADELKLSAAASVCSLTKIIDKELVTIGSCALINNEIVRVDAIDLIQNTVTLARGCADTVPAAHAVNSSIWFYSESSVVSDSFYTNNQISEIKLLSATSKGQLDIDAASAESFTTAARASRPYPPARVKINSLYYPQTITGNLDIRWSHRNRLTQILTAPAFVDEAATAEDTTVYNVRIYDADNKLIDSKNALTDTEYSYVIPRHYDGVLESILDLDVAGISDQSPQNLTVKNDFNALSKSEGIFFDSAILKTATEYQKLDIYNEDHTIELRLKTASVDQYNDYDPSVLHIRIAHDRKVSENTSLDYALSVQAFNNKIRIEVRGTRLTSSDGVASETGLIVYTAENLTADTYHDIAVQCIEQSRPAIGGTEISRCMITVFFNGTAVQTGLLDIIGHDYPCSLKINLSPQYQYASQVALNGMRITKRSGGRYIADYTPEVYAGENDEFWSDVIFLMKMNDFQDMSNLPALLEHSEMVEIKNDVAAHNSSAMHFYKPDLKIGSHPILNLHNRSFVIEGRMKCGGSQIFSINGSMMLSLNQYQLTLSNFDLFPETVVLPLVVGVAGDWSHDKYFGFKIMRDAATGQTSVWFDNKSISGHFNPTTVAEPVIVISPDVSSYSAYLSKFSIYSADESAALVPSIKSPIRIELESQKNNLKSYQMFTATVEVE